MGRPTGVSSNNRIGAMPDFSSRAATVRLVLVPIIVVTPPRIVAKSSGIRYGEGDFGLRCAQSMTEGVIIATSVVLLRNADAPATGSNIRIRADNSLLARPKIRPRIASSAPVLRSAAAIT